MDWLKKKKKKKKEKEKQRLVEVRERGAMLMEDLIQCCDGKSNPIKFFSADQIIKATNNFSEFNSLRGLWRPLYSGKIDNHPMIFLPGYERRDYYRDIAMSSIVSGHKNFMKLLGCCLEFRSPVAVYDFIKISDLDLKMVVSWKRRIKIAEDISVSLAYLHTAFPRPFVYRIMSLDNIVLDEDGVARLCDFSCCISIPQGKTSVQVGVEGAYDFVDDKYFGTGTVSEKTDVFAIGILMQMLLTGQERFRELCEEYKEETRKDNGDRVIYETMSERNVSTRLAPRGLSKSTEERRMDEIADPKMLEKMDEVGEEELCQMKAFLRLSLGCIGLKGEVPNMVEVAKELKNIQRSSQNASSSSSSPSGETKVDSAQDISSSV